MGSPAVAIHEDAGAPSFPSRLIAARAPWDDVVLVCRKCQRKQKARDDLDGASFSKWLKRALNHAGYGRVRVVESACLDLCPKKGIAMALGSRIGVDRKPLRVLRNKDPAVGVLTWLRGALAPAAAGTPRETPPDERS